MWTTKKTRRWTTLRRNSLNLDEFSVELVRSSEDRPGGRRLLARDAVGALELVGEEFDALGRTIRSRKLAIVPAHLDHFAGMLTDTTCLSDRHEVSLDEPIYRYKILVKWEGVHRVLSFLSRPTPEDPRGKVEFRIRLSPLEARRLARLAERCVSNGHASARLETVIARLERIVERLEKIVSKPK